MNPRGRLTRLIKYATGEDLIKYCILQPSAAWYKNAIRLLESRYGDPFKILASYQREIKKLLTTGTGDKTAFRQFHILTPQMWVWYQCKVSYQQLSSEGYKNAMGLLESRYEDSLKILASYCREIKKWPSIGACIVVPPHNCI